MTPPNQFEEALLDAALCLPDVAAGKRFLEQACGGDVALRERLEELLDMHAEAERFFAMDPLQATAVECGSEKAEASASEEKPRSLEGANARIGRYR